jgi:hypothetical protein
MQAKDIPDVPVLEFLNQHVGEWCNWVDLKTESTFEIRYQGRSVLHAMPEGTVSKLALAKMKSLIKRGLVDGCACGCRGDFQITREGKQFLRLAALGGKPND